jgi:hypothetical protein
VQLGNRRHEAQAKPISGGATSVIESIEALQDLVVMFACHPGPGVADLEDKTGATVKQPYLNISRRRCVFDGVVEKIGECLKE